MISRRLASPALWAILAFGLTGCRTAGVRDLARNDLLVPPRLSTTASEVLADHNRNASRVESLEARPSVTITSGGRSGGVSGKLAMERPRNFKLVLSGPVNEVADLGSNDREFWFWVKDSKDKAVYFCNYEDLGENPLSSSLQPDWIVEAMGLRVFPDEEMADIKLNPGKDPGTLLLSYRTQDGQRRPVVKETVVSESTGRIREHRVLSGDSSTLLARAVVSEYQELPLPNAADPSRPEKVFLPKKLRLEWVQEELTLDVSLSRVKVNPRYDENRRAELFVEPEMSGIARVPLNRKAPFASAPRPRPSGPTSVRNSMPIPPPRVNLDEPSPLGGRLAPPPADDSAALAVRLPLLEPRGVEEVVGPPIPTVNEPARAFVQANSGWKSRLSPAVER